MPRSFAEEDFEEDPPKRDTEITLGPAMLLAILCGLILLCGLCFGIGYTAGRRNAPKTTITQSAAGQTVTTQPGGAVQKPLAKGTIPSAARGAGSVSQPAAGDGAQSGNGLTSYAPAGSPSASNSNEVRPAFSPQSPSQGSGPSNTPGAVQPALPQSPGIMVQIAAVSHVEDANVLMGALRKRGYVVVTRREPSDNMIHVQVGPFATRAEAEAMSQRLLSDGYNAIVMP
jgi:DedD protein